MTLSTIGAAPKGQISAVDRPLLVQVVATTVAICFCALVAVGLVASKGVTDGTKLIDCPTGFSGQDNNCTTVDKYRFQGEPRLENIRMLTNDGENAEAYFNRMDTRYTYQSHVVKDGCDQIYSANMEGKDVRQLSQGGGRTTCAFYLPPDTGSGSDFVYASTRAASATCPPPPDPSKGYVWKLYDEFNIWRASEMEDGTIANEVQLTDTPKYDAEATVGFSSNTIVFTSMRTGDPEIYTMNFDGSNVKQLTTEKGYDGGPFFNWDDSKIVYRASRPETPAELADYEELVNEGLVRPTAMELYVMDADGSNNHKITDFKAAAFAPFWHPDNKRIVFCSNKDSVSERAPVFAIYMVNSDGKNIEKITNSGTFDGFPMFTKNGKQVIFASNRFNVHPHDTNLFMADWVEPK